MMLRIFSILLLFFVTTSSAQKISAKLLDKENKTPIPFATIQYAKQEGTMSNEEGDFEFEKPKQVVQGDSLTISSLGYKVLSLALTDAIPPKIYLEEEIFEIAPVVLSNKKLEAEEIIERVKENLVNNYHHGFIKSQIFIRNSTKDTNEKFELNLKESSINEIDMQLFNEMSLSVPKDFTSHKEILGNAFHNTIETKSITQKGLLMRNATEIGSTEEIEKKLKATFEKAIKPDSYLVFKTGIIKLGETETIDEMKKDGKMEVSIGKSKEGNDKEKDESLGILSRVLDELFVNPNSDIDFISDSHKYFFEKVGYVKIDGTYVMVMNFSPKRKAKFKGKIYVNIEDFAIVRADIEGAKKIFDKHFNMFGISANSLTYKSTVMFTKKKAQYYLHYFKKQGLTSVGLDRNFTIIEKNKNTGGRKRQNKLKFNLNLRFLNFQKLELVQTDISSMSEGEFKQVNVSKAIELKESKTYPADFWNGYNILTPEKAIKELKIED